MARTPSTMLDLGTPAPDFALTDAVTGETVRRDRAAGERGLLVMFVCNHCPFVIHVRDELKSIAHDYAVRGVGAVAISSNSPETHPQDGPEAMAELAKQEGWRFPYLFDADQSVAKAYRAACTPDFFLFDGDLKLFYRGQLDGARPGNDVPVDGRDLRAALDAIVAGDPPPEDQKPSMGCNIKWALGNEPEYAG